MTCPLDNLELEIILGLEIEKVIAVKNVAKTSLLKLVSCKCTKNLHTYFSFYVNKKNDVLRQMKLPPVLLLLVSVLISNDKLHKVITTLALELQGQKQSFFIKVVAAMSIVDRRCRGNFEIAIHIEHNHNV